MPTDLHHVSVFVKDMNRSLALYKEILEFDLLWRKERVRGRKFSAFVGIPDVEMDLVFLKSKTGCFALELARITKPALGKDFVPAGSLPNVSLSLLVDSADQLHRKLSERGWIPFTPCVEFDSPDGEMVRGFCFRTDEGINVEIIQVL